MAVVTGASRGIGRAVAERLAAQAPASPSSPAPSTRWPRPRGRCRGMAYGSSEEVVAMWPKSYAEQIR
ncbi:MAG TPA: hypothetical protein VE646_05075, partial [Actinomycetota bacterium]|nr:hypothetical protein [Actinomycetota bacterium]